MGKLAQRILSILAAGLGLNHDQFKRYFREESTSVLRINHYPPCPHPDKIEGLDEHRDPTLITILHQDDVGGLQILKDGKWVGIHPNPQTFIVNIGDILMVSLPSFFFLLDVSSPPTFLDYPPLACNAQDLQDHKFVLELPWFFIHTDLHQHTEHLWIICDV